MNWIQDNAVLSLVGLIVFAVLIVAAFFKRNNAAKTEGQPETDDQTKQEGTVSIAKTRK